MITIARKPTIVSSQKKLFFGPWDVVRDANMTAESPPNAGGDGITFPDAVTAYINFGVNTPQGARGVRSIKIFIDDNVAGTPTVIYGVATYNVTSTSGALASGLGTQINESGTLVGSHAIKVLSVPQNLIDDINSHFSTFNNVSINIGRAGANAGDTLVGPLYVTGIMVELK